MQCEVCRNDYHEALDALLRELIRYFDSCECALAALAPRCEHCGCRIVGPGVQLGGRTYCCDSCAARLGGSRQMHGEAT